MIEQTESIDRNLELCAMAKARSQRFKDFEFFFQKAKEIFEPFKYNGDRERYYDDFYNLAVCPGSRMGGLESRIVEFFWGKRLFDKNESINQDGRRSIHFESEDGTTMFFFKNDNGYVSIQLYPDHTEHRSPIEDFIFWRMEVNPSQLLKQRFQKRCWRAFMAYMEVTSIDGAPTLYQRIQVWYYRNFKRVVVNKKSIPPRYLLFLNKVSTWVMTVGFSGLVIFLLQIWLQPSPSEHKNILDVKNSVQNVEKTIKQLQIDVSRIECNQDSIIKIQTKSNPIGKCQKQ